MTVNLTALSSITTTATALSNLVMVSPQSTIGYQPQNGFTNNSSAAQSYTNSAILFHYEGEQTVQFESDITDHYIENNSAIQDMISIKPEIITTHGFIGELNDIAPYPLQLLQQAASKLTAIAAYQPQLSATALLAYNEAFQAYQVAVNAAQSAVSAYQSIAGLVSGSGTTQSVIGNNGLNGSSSFLASFTQSKQQAAFQQFWGYWNSRTLFTVQTPWAVFQNMAIMKLRAIQSAETNVITDFEVTFKRIKQAKLTTISATEFELSQAIRDSRNYTQAEGAVTNNSTPQPSSTPFNDVLASTG